MPKLKTKSSARKRFKITATGKIKRRHAGYSHLKLHKSPARKRRLRKPTLVSSADKKKLLRVLH
ncbi:MAG: 50S ribosomal protein L35 [Candidatus Sumerlaeia bacterium]|nr:50S ribosomal protein L35 [Candidatus Sumerlaeia bacterium]